MKSRSLLRSNPRPNLNGLSAVFCLPHFRKRVPRCEAFLETNMRRPLVFLFAVTLATATIWSQRRSPERDALIARAKSLEINTPYVPPPGDALEHHTSGFAKIMCSAVFITGLAPDFAAENVGYFTSPYEERTKVGKPVVDRANRTVAVTLPSGVTRTAKHLGSQGCVTFPLGKSSVNFTPVSVKSALPVPSTQL